MPLIISIKSKYARKIFKKLKLVELRKIFSRKYVGKRAIVYSSGEDKAIIGEFKIGDVYYGDVDTIWNEFSDKIGITKEEFDAYFGRRKKGYAIIIENPTKFDSPIPLREIRKKIPNWNPPQSYIEIPSDHPLLRLIDRRKYKKLEDSSV